MPQGRTAVVIGALLAIGAVLIAAAGPLGALPALLVFAVLFAGHYPGAESIDRLIVAVRHRGLPARPSSLAAPRRPLFVLIGRGGFLIASSLAKRPPPALLSQHI